MTFVELEALRTKSWLTVFDVLKQRGIRFQRKPYRISGYILFGLALIAVFATTVVSRAKGDIPWDVFLIAAFAITGILAALRLLDLSSAQELVITDTGVESSVNGSRQKTMKWSAVLRAGIPPFFSSPLMSASGEHLWLAGEFKGRNLVAQLFEWSVRSRGQILHAGGSLTQAMDGLASGEGLSFAFDWWKSICDTALFVALFLGFASVLFFDRTPIAERSISDIVVFILLLAFLASLVLVPAFAWRDFGKQIVVTSRGITVKESGRKPMELTWADATQPDALKRRKEVGCLACTSHDKITFWGDNMRGAELLAAMSEHFLIGELQRRGLTGSMQPSDVRGDPE